MTRSKCLDNLWQSNFLCTPFYFTYCKKRTMKKRPSNWSRFSTFDFQLLIGVDCRHQAISRKVRSEIGVGLEFSTGGPKKKNLTTSSIAVEKCKVERESLN